MPGVASSPSASRTLNVCDGGIVARRRGRADLHRPRARRRRTGSHRRRRDGDARRRSAGSAARPIARLEPVRRDEREHESGEAAGRRVARSTRSSLQPDPPGRERHRRGRRRVGVDERLARRRSRPRRSPAPCRGVNDSSQPLSAMTTTPIAASVPNARRRRSAVGGDRSLARARRGWATWRAVRPTNSIAATSDRLEQQHPAVAVGEQRAAVEPVQLDEAADDGDDDRRVGDAAEPAHGVDEVLLARPGEHDPGEQHDAAEPDRHRQRVHDAGDDAEDGEVAAGAATARG